MRMIGSDGDGRWKRRLLLIFWSLLFWLIRWELERERERWQEEAAVICCGVD